MDSVHGVASDKRERVGRLREKTLAEGPISGYGFGLGGGKGDLMKRMRGVSVASPGREGL